MRVVSASFFIDRSLSNGLIGVRNVIGTVVVVVAVVEVGCSRVKGA